MRQKNVTPYELFSAGTPEGPAVVVAPGEIVDYPVQLTGCELVEDEPAPAKSTKAASAPATNEEPTK